MQENENKKQTNFKMISKADAGVHSFHLGENALADLTTDEIRIRFNGFIQRYLQSDPTS